MYIRRQMDWKSYWNRHAAQGDELKQVARTGYPGEKMHRLMQQQAAYIAELLKLDGSQQLLDVCCGNGVFTAGLRPYCAAVTGVDLSDRLIAQAQERTVPGLLFDEADVLNLVRWPRYASLHGKFDAITMCFSFQYFDTVEKGYEAIRQLLPLMKSGGAILLTDVPDRAKFFQHYNTFPKIAGLIAQMAKGRNEMGKFWSEEELAVICSRLNITGKKLAQPAQLPYAHYRMDYLIVKP